MGNVERTHHTQQYEFTFATKTGKQVNITAYGMERITRPVNELDPVVLKELLPEYYLSLSQGKSANFDVLLVIILDCTPNTRKTFVLRTLMV